MTSTCSAAATALPMPIQAFGDPIPRRGFLSGLAKLPLIGGSVTLFGKPTAVAEPVTYDMLQAYKTWLHYEHRRLSWEMADLARMVEWYGGDKSYRYDQIEPMISFVGVGEAQSYHHNDCHGTASSRAALVMSTVGCDWREREG